MCGDNRKNARWNAKKEYWVCSKCGVTQPMEIALSWTGESFKETTQRIRGEKISMEQTAKTQDIEKDTARLKSIYAAKKPLDTAYLQLS